MEWVNHYLPCPYVDGGRGPVVYDCWGLVREVLHKYFDQPLLSSFGAVTHVNKLEIAVGYESLVGGFSAGEIRAGSIAAGFVGNNLIHVGVCVECYGRLMVLHTSRKRGVRVCTVRDFRRLFLKTEFYFYDGEGSNLSQ